MTYFPSTKLQNSKGEIVNPARDEPVPPPDLQPVRVDGSVPVTTQRATGTVAGAFIVSTSAVRLAGVNASRLSLIIANNGSGRLYLGRTSAVAASGPSMGIGVPAGASYSDTGNGVSVGEMWGVYSAAATTQNVSVLDRS